MNTPFEVKPGQRWLWDLGISIVVIEITNITTIKCHYCVVQVIKKYYSTVDSIGFIGCCPLDLLTMDDAHHTYLEGQNKII
jgi:hypothetical protein